MVHFIIFFGILFHHLFLSQLKFKKGKTRHRVPLESPWYTGMSSQPKSLIDLSLKLLIENKRFNEAFQSFPATTQKYLNFQLQEGSF